jgi:hypothetical protein
MALYENGPLTQWNSVNAGAIPYDAFGVAINWYINRTPLTARLPKLPTGSASFNVMSDDYRPRSTALTAAFSDTTGTVLTVADSSIYDVGDVVEVQSEKMLITAIASSTTATVTRGYAGTTAATHSNSLTAYLLTNSRTGAEVDVASVSRIPATVTQYCQTVQHAYQVGGALQADTNYASGFNSPLDRDRMLAMQHTMDDFEGAIYYGGGVALAAQSTRPAMKGLRTLISTNNTTSPTNASAYKPTDLIRDTIQACTSAGGNPNLLLLSSDFQSGLATWGHPAMRIDAGATAFGVSIDTFEAPFLNGITIVMAPLLRTGTAICLATNEARIRMKRNLFDKPRGSRGDAIEGDFIMEGAIELDNPNHHAYVSGITGFAAS